MKNWLMPLLALFALPAAAQIQFNSIQEVLNYADANAVAIQSAVIGEQIALEQKKEAGSYLLPTLNSTLGYNDNITLQPTLIPAETFNPNAPEGTFEELVFGTKYIYSAGMQVQWDVLNFQKIFTKQTASLATEESRLNTEVSRYNTYNSLASTYYSILLTQASIGIYEKNVEVSASILDLARTKYDDGLISEPEINLAEIKHLNNQRMLMQANDNLRQFYIQLQSQLNTRDTINILDAPESFVTASTTIETTHPEVLLQETEARKQESTLKQNKAMRIPSLSLVYQYNQSLATNDFWGFSDAIDLTQQYFGAKVTLPLINTSTRYKVRRTKEELALQQLQLESTRLAKQKEDELLQVQLKQANDQLNKQKRILALQEKNDVHAENKYKSGIISLEQRLDQYDDLLAAQDTYLQSLASFTLSQYKLFIRQLDFQPN
ncbi:MAG: TolC family protein [Saprospiraceae bacterium]|nr:TolC family protein [Saprospiraceae bacterium]